MASVKYAKMAGFSTPDELRAYLRERDIILPLDDEILSGKEAPLGQPISVGGRTVRIGGRTVGNRFCVLPMEGWDCLADGRPGELTRRRWQRFGQSGAKLIWGGEACAVRDSGKGNRHQMLINQKTVSDIAKLRADLAAAHEERFGTSDDLVVGLQLTHSGRFSCPNDKNAPQAAIVYHHPILDRRMNLPDDYPCLTDGQIVEIIDSYVRAAVLSQKAGFSFVDIKHCHGYLGHEFLSARQREGRFGGCFENRTRFLRQIVSGIRNEAPGLDIGVRLSLFDFIPFRKREDGIGVAELYSGEYPFAFGGDGTGTGIDLSETLAFLDLLDELDIRLVCATAGSPYYNPHIQRPALFPPSDGYEPPEDPLVGVSRLIEVTSQLKRARPGMVFVGCGYTYLQEWLGNVAQAAVRTGVVDAVGLGRMTLPYPDMMADILDGKQLDRKRICRTLSDCTTAPRSGLVSGCYPLDDHYKNLPEAKILADSKRTKCQ
jgi:2,4-dienoyl-CoA reductase-like NADH-dependent reductase (Old Yellow Enzyme family)